MLGFYSTLNTLKDWLLRRWNDRQVATWEGGFLLRRNDGSIVCRERRKRQNPSRHSDEENGEPADHFRGGIS